MHVITALGIGGAERVYCQLIGHLEELGDRCLACTLADDNGFASRLRDAPSGGLVTLHHSGAVGNVSETLASAWRLRKVARDFGATVIHSHLWPSDIVASLASLGTGLLHLSHQHGMSAWIYSSTPRARLRKIVTRILFRLANTHFIAVSAAVQRHMTAGLRLSTKRFRTIHNGVELGEFDASARRSPTIGPPLILAAGRFSEEKGFTNLITALADLHARGQRFSFVLAGDGSLRSDLEQRVAGLQLQHADVVGPVEDMNELYRAADIFVLPSLSEGLPLVLLEAMASGLAIVATDVGGVREALSSGDAGIVVPPADHGRLVEALERLVSDAGLRQRMGSAAHAAARNRFSSAMTAAAVSELYGEWQRKPPFARS